MAVWSDFYPGLTSSVSGCPEPMLDFALRKAAAEFFRRTRAWTIWLAPVTTLALTRDYALTLPAGSDVVRIERAAINGSVIEILGYRDLQLDPSLHAPGENGVTTLDRKLITLGMDYPAGSSLEIQVALMPSKAALGITDVQFDHYSDDIAQGAKARLMLMPGQPFSNPNLGVLAKELFEHAVATKNVDSWRSHTANTPAARVRWC